MQELLVISAVWCPSCLILNKNIKKLRKEYPELNIKKLNFDLDEDEIKEYNIGILLPVMIIKVNNIEKKRLKGEKSYEEIISFLKEGNMI